MRLLLVTAEFPSIPGGVGDYTLHLGHALVRSGHEVCVVTSADSRVVGDSEFAVHPDVASWGPGGIPALARVTRGIKADAVLFQYVPYLYARWGAPAHLPWLLDAVRSGGRSVVLVCHELFVFEGRFKHRLVGFIQRTALWLAQRRADALVVTTGRRREWLAAHGFNVSRVSVVRVGSSILPPASISLEAPAATGRPFRVVMFGHLDLERRRLDVVCNAIERLGRGRPDERVELRLIGPLRATACDHLASRLLEGPGFSIRTCGVLPAEDVARQLAESDAAVLFETTGLGGLSSRSTACAAAFAAGLPLVGNGGGDTDAIYRDGQNVMFCPIDPDALAGRLGALRYDLSLRARVRAGARELYDRELSWSRIAGDFVTLVAPLAGARGGGTARRGATS